MKSVFSAVGRLVELKQPEFNCAFCKSCVIVQHMVSAVIVVLISAVICTICRIPDVCELCHVGGFFLVQLFDELGIDRSAISVHSCQFLSIFSCKMKFNYHMFSSRFSVICLSAVHMLTLFSTDSNCEMCRMFRLSFVRIRQMRFVLLLFCNRLDSVQFRYTADAVAWQLHQ